MLCFVSWTTQGQGPQMGACHRHQGSWFKQCVCQGLPKRPVLPKHVDQLRPRYGVEEDLDPGQASESMVPQENLGSGVTPKELGDSRVKEPEPQSDLEGGVHHPDVGGHGSRKLNPTLPMGSEYGPHNPKRFK